MVRTNQGGSVLGFVVVGAVLVLLFAGGAYLVRQHATTPETVQPASPAKPEDKKPSNQGDSQTPSDKTDTSPAPSHQSPAAPSQPLPSSSTDASQLPQTGPAELFGTLLALGLLSSALVSYYRSRRPELSL